MTRTPFALVAAVLAAACSDVGAPRDPDFADVQCSIPTDQIFDGGPGKDGIPALVDPVLVGADGPDLEFLREDDRVIGLLWNGVAVAVPHNIGWWHEVVNLDLDGLRVAVTFCPLTGSSLAFDRAPAGGAAFGVSGLLYRNNLIMYDRNAPESLWPQMSRGARCGVRSGTALPMVPVVDLTWAAWRRLHPDTRVVSSRTGIDYDYTLYPYGSYDRVGNDALLFPLPSVDRRRPLKERVLGIPGAAGAGGIAFPFAELARRGRIAAVPYERDGETLVILWNEDAGAAMAYRPVVDGETVRFEVREGRLHDVATGSVWGVDGMAHEGPRAGARLEPVAEAYTAFWFAWAAFHADTRIWTGEGAT